MVFEIFHLKDDIEGLSSLIDKLKKPYRDADESILMHYCLNQAHLEECRSKHSLTHSQHYKEKTIVTKQVIDAGGYVKVADVTADHMIDAFIKTTNINQRWFLAPSKGVVPLGKTLRSTQSYDLMRWEQNDYLILPLGYLDIQTGEFFELKR